MELIRYTPDHKAEWDDFVEKSANGTFLHLRGYMDYHADRFADHSLMAYDSRGRLVAVLPANIEGSVLCSHRGLTFGGWLTATRHFDASDMLEVWECLRRYMVQCRLTELVYKPVPWIYHRLPSDSDIYALFRNGATVQACLVASAVSPYEPQPLNKRAERQIKSAVKNGIEVRRSSDYAAFMNMLTQRLGERYDAKPVHTLAELELLAAHFPDNIKLYMAWLPGADSPAAATLIYESHRVMHCQYIATTEAGRNAFAFAAIVGHLSQKASESGKYLDFGTSNEQGGRVLNATLNQQKYGFGGRPVGYLTYRLLVVDSDAE